jgi:hypothetical protein
VRRRRRRRTSNHLPPRPIQSTRFFPFNLKRNKKDSTTYLPSGLINQLQNPILKIAAAYNSFTVEEIDQACTPSSAAQYL